MLKNEMPRTGQWLFVRRSFVPFLLVPILALTLAEDHVAAYLSRYVNLELPGKWEYVWDGACFGVSMIGVFVRALAIGYAAKGTSGRNTREGQKAEEVNTTGLYSLVRNPLYLGNLFITLGIVLTTRSWELLVISCLAFLLYYERIIAAEEAFLEEKFGGAYREWSSATPCLWPRFSAWRPSPRSLSLRKMVRSEYQSVSGIVVAIFCIKLARDRLAGHPFEVDRVYGIALIAAAAVYVIVRTIKKHTRLLRV